MRKLVIIAVLALCLTTLAGVGASGNEGITSGIESPGPLGQYRMEPGDWISDSRNAYGLWQLGYIDVYHIVNDGPGTGNWSMEIRDCCTADNLMLAIKLGKGGLDWGWAAHPDIISLGPVSMAPYEWVVVITGYIYSPTGFPTAYYYDIWMEPSEGAFLNHIDR